jgi:Fungal trichothecene efflux pump (TRI12)
VAIIKRVQLQLIFLMLINVAFLGAMASCSPTNLARSAVLSVFAAFPAGILEIMAGLLVQMDTDDADLGTTFCK